MRFIIRLSYNGAGFHGWQIQPHDPTVQEHIEKALSMLLKTEITITGAGRTDTDVNAVNYVAHFDAPVMTADEAEKVRCKLNAILPAGIAVHEVSGADDDFHSRFDASEREYRYFLHRKKDPFIGNHSYFCTYPLDVEVMNCACRYLLGEHDFSCFEKTGGGNKTSICNVKYAAWEPYIPDHVRLMGFPAEDGDYLVFTIRADRFLRNMVRAVTGTLIEIGRGRKPASWMEELVRTGTRSDAGQSVPGSPLFLDSIKY